MSIYVAGTIGLGLRIDTSRRFICCARPVLRTPYLRTKHNRRSAILEMEIRLGTSKTFGRRLITWKAKHRPNRPRN